ncbi:MAG TPA: hypothetical protein VNW92_19550 [Polyangiaceae bacterium]|nr:hypothetical protein [Polyangiaceae bacterium]
MTFSGDASGFKRQAATVGMALLFGNVLSCTSETRVNLLERVLADGASPTPEAAPPGSAGSDAGTGREGAEATTSSSHLIHRYSFSGEGTRVVDSVSGADGVLMAGATLDGAGHAALDGLDDYVDLPNGLVSSLHDATLLTW